MIIEKIVIKSFGLLTDMTLEFSDGINVIEGRNESGKSTIAAFIRYMLYGFDNSEPDDLPSERRKRINWDTGVAAGSMYVRVKGKRYLITRTTTPTDTDAARPTYREDASIVDLETGSPAFGKMPAGEVFFGVDRELFDNTAFIGQINDAGINEGKVKEAIENILFSGNERINAQRATGRISDKMDALLHKSGSGGAIFDLVRRQEDYKARIDRTNEDNKNILAKETELYEIRDARERAIEDREHFREIDGCYNNLMVIQTFDRLHELEEQSERAGEAYAAFIRDNAKDGFTPDEEYLTELAVARELVNKDYQRLTEAEALLASHKGESGITRETEGLIERCDTLGGEAAVLKRAGAARMGIIKWLAFGIFGMLAAVCALVSVLLGKDGELTPTLVTLFSIGGGASFIFAITSFILAIKSRGAVRSLAASFGMKGYTDLRGKLSHISEARVRRDTMISALEAAEAAVASAKESYAASKSRLAAAVGKWACGAPLGELGEFLDALDARVREFLNRKNELLNEKTNTELTVKDIRQTLANKSEIDIRAQVSPLKRKALSGVNHDEIISGIASNKAKIQDYDARAVTIENELNILKNTAGDLGEYYAKLRSVEARIDELKTRHKAFFIAKEAISGAMEKLRTEISPRLGEYATEMMQAMTAGRYSEFAIDDSLKLSFTQGKEFNHSIDFLSGGTRELAYVALRCALIDMLYREKPPVLFDESFAHQDNVRAAAMMRAIKRLADEKCQSFVFTCRNRESALAKDVSPEAGIFKLSVVDADND